MKEIFERVVGIRPTNTGSKREPLKVGTLLRDRYQVKDFLFWDGRRNHYVVTDIVDKGIYELREFSKDQEIEVEREIVTKRLNHWGIVQRHDLFSEDNRTYIVSDYYRVPSLEDIRRVHSARDIIGIAFTLVDTLHYLHSHGIAQIDLSAKNIKDMKEVQKIIDFSDCRLFSGPSTGGFRDARERDFLGLIDLLERLVLRIMEESEGPSILHLIKSLEEMVASPPNSAADFKERLSQCNPMETNRGKDRVKVWRDTAA